MNEHIINSEDWFMTESADKLSTMIWFIFTIINRISWIVRPRVCDAWIVKFVSLSALLLENFYFTISFGLKRHYHGKSGVFVLEAEFKLNGWAASYVFPISVLGRARWEHVIRLALSQVPYNNHMTQFFLNGRYSASCARVCVSICVSSP